MKPIEQDFDPTTSTRRFALVQSDYSMVLPAQPLSRILRDEAPGVRLRFQQLTASTGDFQETIRQSDGMIVPPGHVRADAAPCGPLPAASSPC